MIYQAEDTASLINEAYSFQSVSGKNINFLQSINKQYFFFRSCTLKSRENLCVHAGGEVTYTVPVHFLQKSLPYTLVLFVTAGSGNVHIGTDDFTLSDHDFLLIPAEKDWCFSTTHTPFSCHAFYLSGNVVDDYLLSICQKDYYYKKDYAKANNTLVRLLPAISQQLSSDTADASLHLAAQFHIMFSALLNTEQQEASTSHIPDYIIRMKQIFDSDYAASHPLDELEQCLGISKYRLCRDFSKYIGSSPVQYLTQIRLSEARYLLRTTNLTIREVGIAVGIENTTHFINIFKKNAGITPLQFRQNLNV